MNSTGFRLRLFILALLILAACLYPPSSALSQVPINLGHTRDVLNNLDLTGDQPADSENLDEGEALDEATGAPVSQTPEEAAAQRDESPVPRLDEVLGEIEGGEPGEGERRWEVKINAAVRANYVFNESPDNFVIKYTFEVKGDANAETAVIRGDADITANVEGFIAKWPTGQCNLNISIPKVPFEITFRKGGEEKGSVALQFRKPIMEDWKSSCSFTDAPGAKFDTSGPPEKWLAVAIEKARPPIRSMVADIKEEETTTSFVIPKQTIDDAPLGTIEVEGTGVVTITPGG